MNLLQHQQKILLDKRPKIGLWHSCGAGKSATAIRWSLLRGNKILVVCPKSIVDNWKDNEIPKWGDRQADWTVISKETFRRDWLKLPKHDVVVYDEAHFFSGYKSAMHKAGVNYINRHNIEYVIALTGTPYMSSPFNLYALGKLLGKDWNWYKFKSFFFKDVQMGPRRIPVPRKDKYPDIIKCYRDLGDFVKLDDIVDIPEHVYQNEYFRLNKAQDKEISSLLDLLPIVRYSKIFQIANGTLKGDGYTEDKEIECDKMDRVVELIESTQKLAIICRHTLEIEAIKKRIKDKRILTLTGATEERKKVIEAFNKIDDCVILIQASISEGYNLYTPVMVFYSLDWSLKNFVQMRARCVRMDYLRSIVYIHLIVKDTIDEAVYDCVVNKKMDFHAELYEKTRAGVRD
jgi:superfamily II DNA or RNA helicase